MHHGEASDTSHGGSPEAGRNAPPEQPPGVPRWLKVSAAVALVIIVALTVVLLASGGHGPPRHLSGLLPPVPTAPAPGDAGLPA